MNNSASCKVVGQGIVHIHSHGGTITILSSVYHVPDFIFNLISLRTINSEEFDYKAKNGCMKVFKDAHIK